MEKSKFQFNPEAILRYRSGCYGARIQNYLIIIALLFVAMPVFAARFSVTPTELVVNQETAVSLTIDPEDEEINAVEVKLKFSPSDFLIKDISDANSIISLWVEKPKFSNETGEISFAGIIPGGYPGIITGNYKIKEGQLLNISLIPKRVAEVNFQIEKAKVLLNDGKGTEAKLSTSNLKFSAIQEGPSISIPLKDEDPPELFVPQITRDPNVFEGKWFLVFNTQDKGWGIDHYEILEAKQKDSILGLFKKDEWQVGESPYLLKDQKLKSYIFVKAVDKAGNERIAKLPPQNPLKWYENWWIWVIIIVVFSILYLVFRGWKTKRYNHSRI